MTKLYRCTAVLGAALMLCIAPSVASAAITQTMVTQGKIDLLRGELSIVKAYAAGVANTVYVVGTRVTNSSNVYELTTALSGNSTTAPTGTTTSTDNGGTWTYREAACAWYLALFTTAATLDATTTAYSTTGEIAGTGGYTQGGQQVYINDVAASGTNAQVTLSGAAGSLTSIVWSTATITAGGAQLYCKTKGATTLNKTFALWSFSGDKTSTAADFTITSSAGVLAVN